MIRKNDFGILSDGQTVHSYTITNQYGEYVTLLDYGATVYEIVVRDRNGELSDVVLGAPDGQSLETFKFMGSTIGRCANRIAHGRYEVDGVTYQLEQNARGHFLHGASGNYAKKLFKGSIHEESQAVTFYHKDTGEGGFDCEVDAYVTFSFDDEGCLSITYDWTGSDTTVLNPTNHTYFNLSGNQDVRDQILEIRASERVSRDAEGLPDGGSIPVEGSPADFTRARSIGDAMEADFGGYFSNGKIMYDEFYLVKSLQTMRDRQTKDAGTSTGRNFASGKIKTEIRDNQLLARLTCPANGRVMEVYSDLPSVVLFVPSVGTDVAGKNGQTYRGYCAVCLESGFVPNAVNCPEYDSPVFRKGETLHSTTVYKFGRV